MACEQDEVARIYTANAHHMLVEHANSPMSVKTRTILPPLVNRAYLYQSAGWDVYLEIIVGY